MDLQQDDLEYKSGRSYDRVKLPRGKAKSSKKYMFEDDSDINEIKAKIKDFLKEKSLELKGFVEETTEKAKEEGTTRTDQAETNMEEMETVEMADSDSDEFEDMLAENESFI